MELGATSYLRPSILPTIPPLRVPRRNEIHTARTTQEYTSNRDANYSPPPHQIRLVSYIGSKGASFPFDPIICECREGAPSIRIGRFSEETFERADFRFTGKITFKSRVVSRRHAELWCGLDGKVFPFPELLSFSLAHLLSFTSRIPRLPRAHLLTVGDYLKRA